MAVTLQQSNHLLGLHVKHLHLEFSNQNGQQTESTPLSNEKQSQNKK